MQPVNERGGARVGKLNASWPLAQLKADDKQLTLNALLIKYTFRPEDVTAIEAYGFAFRKGIRIHHRVKKFSNKVIFWSSGDPARLIGEIRRTGFMDNMQPLTDEDINMIRNRKWMDGVAIKTWVLLVLIVLWNIPPVLIKFLDKTNAPLPFRGAGLGAGLLVLSCLLILFAKPVQKLVLKEGRELSEMKPMVWFILGICSLFCLVFSLIKVPVH